MFPFTPAPQSLASRLDGVGQWLAPLGLRTLLAWEFFEAGREKLQGENWFAQIADKFPLPFSLLGPNVNWALATWFELIASVALLVGLGTRYAAATLWVLTIVAIYAVHWPSDWSSLSELWQGYAISNDGHGNYKLPLIYLAMLLPLMLGGGGRFSLDQLLRSFFRAPPARAASDAGAWGLVLFAVGTTISLLLPWAGMTLAIAGIAAMTWPRRPATTRALPAI
ncbi:MAG TPA: DoxX family protein [Lysobacter sp.]